MYTSFIMPLIINETKITFKINDEDQSEYSYDSMQKKLKERFTKLMKYIQVYKQRCKIIHLISGLIIFIPLTVMEFYVMLTYADREDDKSLHLNIYIETEYVILVILFSLALIRIGRVIK